MVQLLAAEFICGLRETAGVEALVEIVERNRREPDPNICHTHDFCDANMVMFEAFEAVLGRPPGFITDGTGSALEEADIELADKAWNLAMSLLKEEFK